ncbi:MAG: hypothetical protein K6F04_01850, partial [bacterium]|nr:hypothetical protein [bacterium]
EFLTWTSDDNLYKSNALEKMISYLNKNKNVDLVSMNFDYIDENGNFIENFENTFNHKRTVLNLLHRNNVGSAFMYRKSIANKVGKYDKKAFCVEDFDYWCRIALSGNISYTSDNIYKYRIHSSSLSATKKTEIDKKTKELRKKYLYQFFNKFKYSWYDRIIAMMKFKIYSKSILNNFIIFLFKFYSLIVRLFSILFFWNKKNRHKFVEIFLPNFSFLCRKG